MSDERRAQALREALEWVNAAFVGDPDDVRNWPVLDPLAPHALAVARHADEAEIAEPTARLFNQLGLLFDAKADYAEAEPLMRRALAIDEKSYGPDHPDVAIAPQQSRGAASGHEPPRRGRAADAPRARDRRKELRPGSSQCGDPPQQSRALLQATNRLAEAEPLMRRALAIDETSYGPDHPDVASRPQQSRAAASGTRTASPRPSR